MSAFLMRDFVNAFISGNNLWYGLQVQDNILLTPREVINWLPSKSYKSFVQQYLVIKKINILYFNR